MREHPKEKWVFCLRHPQSQHNVDNIQRGPDSELTHRGNRQRAAIARYIATLQIDTLCGSTAKRAATTVRAISRASGVPYTLNDLFLERRGPSMAIGRNSTTDLELSQTMQQIKQLDVIFGQRHSDEEIRNEFFSRIERIFEFLNTSPGRRICLVTHNHVLRAMVCYVLGHGSLNWFDVINVNEGFMLDNGSMTLFHYKRMHKSHEWFWHLNRWNLVSHLPDSTE